MTETEFWRARYLDLLGHSYQVVSMLQQELAASTALNQELLAKLDPPEEQGWTQVPPEDM